MLCITQQQPSILRELSGVQAVTNVLEYIYLSGVFILGNNEMLNNYLGLEQGICAYKRNFNHGMDDKSSKNQQTSLVK